MARNREKFVELAESRVNRAVKDMKLVANLANRNNYEYTTDDANEILKTLKKAVQYVESRFKESTQEDELTFSLDR